jgi:hypothetical protein
MTIRDLDAPVYREDLDAVLACLPRLRRIIPDEVAMSWPGLLKDGDECLSACTVSTIRSFGSFLGRSTSMALLRLDIGFAIAEADADDLDGSGLDLDEAREVIEHRIVSDDVGIPEMNRILEPGAMLPAWVTSRAASI